MNKNEIIKSLKSIGISDYKQLENNSIQYWWEKAYLKVRYNESIPTDEKTNILININSSKEILETLDIDYLKDCLKSENEILKNNSYSNRSQKNKNIEEEKIDNNNSNYRFSEKNNSNSKRTNFSQRENKKSNSRSKNNSSNNFFKNIKNTFTEPLINQKSINLNNPIQGILSYVFLGPIIVAILASIFGLNPIELWVAIYLLCVLYFFPTVIARSRMHRNFLAIFALNLFLGWTFFGWLFALIWSLNNK